MSKHTPGPLEVRTAGKDPKPCVFTESTPSAPLGTPVARFERIEDARLFAALPDLLAALQLVLESSNLSPGDCYNHDGTPNALWGSIDRAKAAARAAIVKATGGDL